LPSVSRLFHLARVRLSQDDLTHKALAALEDVADRAELAPVRPSPALRFALAYLYAVGDGARWPYDGFWQAVTRGFGTDAPSRAAAIGRFQSANACLNGIYRSVRVTRPG